jgi:hypothetical protein
MEQIRWDDIAAVLGDVDFPANKQDIVNHARQRQANGKLLTLISDLPVGIYRNLVDVRLSAKDGVQAAGPAGRRG